jgi:NHL repeat-containing protein
MIGKTGLLAAALCLSPGCGVGGVLVALAGGGGGGGSKSEPKPPAPAVFVSLPDGPEGSNLVPFKVRLTDARLAGSDRNPRVRITPTFAPTGGEFRPMTEAAVAQSEGTRGLTLVDEHTFVWNAFVDLGAAVGDVRFRFEAAYEDAEGITRKFVAYEDRLHVDGRLAATVFGADVRDDSDVDTFPIDIRPDGDGFMVACLGANIVERVGPTGRIDRVVGLGIPGTIANGGQAPGVARLPLVFGFDLDPAGNVLATHGESVSLTNRSGASVVFGLVDEGGTATPDTTTVAPQTVATVIGAQRSVAGSRGQLGPPISFGRAMRRHPTGALLFIDGAARVTAVNPQDPASGASTSVTLAGVVIGPGEAKVILGGGTQTGDDVPGTDALLTDAYALGIGPDGEVYCVERGPSRVRVLNTTAAPITVGGASVAANAVRTVVGGPSPGFGGDGGPATSAKLDQPSSVDVSPQRVLFIADTNNVVVRAANMSGSDVTFAETTIAAGAIDTVAGGGTGGVGSKARAFAFEIPNGASLDTNGNLLVADGHRVVFVNGSTATVESYGATTGAGRVALVYDATNRGGLILVEPRALASPSPDVLYVTDRSSVRVLNLGAVPAVYGGASAYPGAAAVLGGGAVTGFAGDGASARFAAFSTPSALATEGPFILYVADTGNDRVRVINTDDARLAAVHSALGVSVVAGNVATVVGGGPPGQADDGDGLAPTAANLSGPQGLAVSNAGLLFIADTGHHRIRVVNPGPNAVTVAGVGVPAGTIATVVGTGTPGFTADGAGPWTIDTPTALAVDRDLLYFGEAGNARIRVLNVSAAPVTVANIVVAPGEVRTICGSGVRGNEGDFGLSVDALIDTPHGFALQTVNGDRAALYFADGPQHVVRMLNLTSDTDLVGALNAQGGVAVTVPDSSIVTLAGGPNTPGFQNAPGFDGDGDEARAMRFAEPWGVAVTTSGGAPAHFFVADSRNQRVRRFGAPPLVQ